MDLGDARLNRRARTLMERFAADPAAGSNVGRNGGGGKFVCCVSLPRLWKPGLVGRVRWSVLDWSTAVATELDAGNYKSIVLAGEYIATVPIEKYDGASSLYAHFFPNGKIRLVSSDLLAINEKHPIRFNDPSAVDLATQGVIMVR